MADQNESMVVGEILFQEWDDYPRERGMQAIWIPEAKDGVWDGVLLVITRVDTRSPYVMANAIPCESKSKAILAIAKEWDNLR